MTAITSKYKSYPAYKPSGVEWLGESPAHWEVKRLKYVAPTRNAKLDNKPEDTIYVGLENIESWTGKLLLDNQADTVDSTVVTFSPGDVLFGKLRPYLAKAAHPDFNGTATGEVLVMRPTIDLSQSYLTFCLLNEPWIHWVDTLTYGARMPRVSPDEVASSFIPLPPLPEQRAIADFLDRETARIDELVSKKERFIELLQEKRSALITRAVTRGLDPDAPMKDTSVEWLGEIPAHWEVKRLKYLADFINGAAFNPAEWATEGTPIIRIQNLNGGDDFNYTTRKLPAKYVSQEGELLFGWSGNRGTSFGPFLWSRKGEYYVNQHIFRVLPLDVTKEWFYWALKAVTFHVERQAHGIIGIVHITREELGAIYIPTIPSVSEQESIAAFLNRETAKIDALVSKVRKAIDHLKELRTALISTAVTGRIDVREEAG